MAASFGLERIGQIAMPVRDAARAVSFYRDRLGLRLLFEAPPALAFFDCGGVRLMLDGAPEEEFRHAGSPLYFRVEDIAAAHAELEGRGVVFRRDPHLVAKLPDHELWMAFFEDGEGNTHALMHEKR